jgi:L-aminopeptidase/D-esterase-like protein
MTGTVTYVHNEHLDPLLFACAYAAEEAIINSMVAGETMTGHRGMTVAALPHGELQEIMKKYNRLQEY